VSTIRRHCLSDLSFNKAPTTDGHHINPICAAIMPRQFSAPSSIGSTGSTAIDNPLKTPNRAIGDLTHHSLSALPPTTR
jgi:hypothetical protein